MDTQDKMIRKSHETILIDWVIYIKPIWLEWTRKPTKRDARAHTRPTEVPSETKAVQTSDAPQIQGVFIEGERSATFIHPAARRIMERERQARGRHPMRAHTHTDTYGKRPHPPRSRRRASRQTTPGAPMAPAAPTGVP